MEVVVRLSLLEALYHAAARYEKDEVFRRPVENPDWVANCLRESAERIERLRDERRLR